jgi:chemotaxis signal transduction protein
MADNLSSSYFDSIAGVLVFNIGILDFCLDIKTVLSTIVPQKQSTIASKDNPHVKEVEYNSEVVPLLDIHTIYGLKIPREDNNTRILLLDFNNKKIAFRVDNIKEIISINKKTRDSLKYESLKNKPYLNGKVIYDGQTILCPDLEKIIRDQKSYRLQSINSHISTENKKELL